MIMGAAIVLVYTLFGGMWSVALTDFFQMTIIVAGMIYIAYVVAGIAGGAGVVIEHAAQAGKFAFWPAPTAAEMLAFAGAAVTMMFGSMPQQDVFQRVMSARSEGVAVTGAVAGGSLYFVFAFVPMFLAYAAQLIDPAMFAALVKDDAQMILPSLILNHTPMAAQILFFGALLSAIMSTASGTLLAPSITLTENILREFMTMNDRQLLLTTRIVVVCFTIAVTSFALVSQGMPIYEMVGNAYKVPLVGAFVPLIAGLYWSRASNQGALLSVLMGLSSWLWMERFGGDSIWPPQLLGLLFALVGMVIGSLLPQRLDKS
jgi:Na+/proline symporter